MEEKDLYSAFGLSKIFGEDFENRPPVFNKSQSFNSETDEDGNEEIYEIQELPSEEEVCQNIDPQVKFYLVFTNGPGREDGSVFYSDLIIATSEQNAIIKFCNWLKTQDPNSAVSPSSFGDDEPYEYSIIEVSPIT